MEKNIFRTFAFLVLVGVHWASGHVEQGQDDCRKSRVDIVLERLNKKTKKLKSYECRIEWKYIQPILDSQTTRKGTLYYLRTGGTSALRVNLDTVKVEDAKEKKAIEQYIVVDGSWLDHTEHELKGVWLAHIDHQLKEVKYYQLAEPADPNESIDVFELASKNLPMLGFAKTEELKDQFEVKLVEQKKGESEEFIQVSLKVKPNSVYKDDFLSIDFWIDKKVGLPAKVRATKTEPEPPYGDVEEIRFLRSKVNSDISRKIFEFKIPRDFGRPEIIPLKKGAKRGQDGFENTER
ncbi:MAG: hypothetical protein JSW59_19415 [Phycisphaerales bacterium]|nr:MAG: hypothetical protein JSW59_19415 [Phycisphaerales bacterium]